MIRIADEMTSTYRATVAVGFVEQVHDHSVTSRELAKSVRTVQIDHQGIPFQAVWSSEVWAEKGQEANQGVG